ncbi:hypothetical protein D1007_09692 [Hordeum vulgare]|nr:hypothetical protein D1007_09692 [Hordeum vulgare]
MSSPPSPTRPADADQAAAAATAAAALAAGNPVDASNSTAPRPRAPATDESSGSGALPLTTVPPTSGPLASSSAPPPPLPASLAGILDFKLALDGTNFTRWRNYIHLMLARHHAEDHIRDVSVRRLADPAWRADDTTIVLWFFTTIEGDLLDIVALADSTAFTIWTRLHEYFLANEAEHAMHLGQEFRACVRGDLTVHDYCRRLQGIAAALADVREPVTDRTLTLQMLDGLGPKFAMQAAIIQSTVPLPTFSQARSRLVLAELSMDKRARTEGAQVLAVQHDERGADRGSDRGGAQGGDRGGGDRGPHNGGGRGGQLGAGRHQRGGRGRGRGRGRGDAPAGRGAGAQPWLGYFASMGLPFPPPRLPWIPPNSAGVLGPRPGVPHQAYPLLLSHAPAHQGLVLANSNLEGNTQ